MIHKCNVLSGISAVAGVVEETQPPKRGFGMGEDMKKFINKGGEEFSDCRLAVKGLIERGVLLTWDFLLDIL